MFVSLVKYFPILLLYILYILELYYSLKVLNILRSRSGQAFDFLKLYSFSIQKYWHAVNLKPNDERLWIALGDSYVELENFDFAKRAYKRAYK